MNWYIYHNVRKTIKIFSLLKLWMRVSSKTFWLMFSYNLKHAKIGIYCINEAETLVVSEMYPWRWKNNMAMPSTILYLFLMLFEFNMMQVGLNLKCFGIHNASTEFRMHWLTQSTDRLKEHLHTYTTLLSLSLTLSRWGLAEFQYKPQKPWAMMI